MLTKLDDAPIMHFACSRKWVEPVRIGVVVNPLAGLGGAVGLKGSDGLDTVARALQRGAVAQAGPRAARALSILAWAHPGTAVVAGPGVLGADWAPGLDVTALDIGPLTGTARDSRAVVEAMGPVDLVVFAGGDGDGARRRRVPATRRGPAGDSLRRQDALGRLRGIAGTGRSSACRSGGQP